MSSINKRGAGLLCHISSLPGKYGIGGLGKEAYDFCDFLKRAHVSYWQILPLAQTGYGDSPYQSVCCNSGNPYFIDLQDLYDRGLLDDKELASCEMPAGNIDYAELYMKRYAVLRLAFARFNLRDPDFVEFVGSGEYDDYAMFMSLKTHYSGTFDGFPDAYKYREKSALDEFKSTVYKKEYCFWLFLQYIFKLQWAKLKAYANSLGIKIIGDLPLYVAYDSSDVWGRPELFMLDKELKPTDVAGVPPDYFSKTGQLWGNPLYNWERMAEDNFSWWINRLKKAAELYDAVRIDHFRGFDRYYSIPFGAETAVVGEWKDGPAMKFFDAVKPHIGDLGIIAEDLGVMDDGVIKLRTETGFPGMKILLFAFDGEETNAYLPSNCDENSVMYTGTHDNDTALGFLQKLSGSKFLKLKKILRAELKKEGAVYPFVSRSETVKALCICALASPSRLAVLPVQDILGLDGSARMNTPSVARDNWRFRLENIPSRADAAVVRRYVKLFDR